VSATDQEETVSASWLRNESQRRGLPLGHSQLREYIYWGFIEAPQAGRMPAEQRWPRSRVDENIDRLAAVRDLEGFSLSLPRRALLMSPDWHPNGPYVAIAEASRGHEIPPACFRAAVQEVLPTIRRPAEAMLALHEASLFLIQKHLNPFFIVPRRTGAGWPFAPPPVSEWEAALARVDIARIAERRFIWYNLADYLSELTALTPISVADIPPEEQVALLAIRDLACDPEPFIKPEEVDAWLRDHFPYALNEEQLAAIFAQQHLRRKRGAALPRRAAAESEVSSEEE
jgi:hypothetical protein